MNKEIRFIVEVGIFSAIGLVLDYLAGVLTGFIWPLGGSISITMTVILVMAYRWGLKGGLITGLLVGTIQLLWAKSSYLIHPIQIILDYPLAYTLVGLAGIYFHKLKKAEATGKLYFITIGALIGGALRTISHIISGYVYFGEWVPDYFKDEGLFITWSILYNVGYMLPSIILCLILIIQMVKRVPNLLEIK